MRGGHRIWVIRAVGASDGLLAEGVSDTVTHLVGTHHHFDHAGGSSLFGPNGH